MRTSPFPGSAAGGFPALWAVPAGLAPPVLAHGGAGGGSGRGAFIALGGAAVAFAGIAVIMVAAKVPEMEAGKRKRLHAGGFAGVFAGVLILFGGPQLLASDHHGDCERPETEARLEIVSPQSGTAVPAGEVEVVLRLTGGRLADEGAAANRPGEGHIHLNVDGVLVSMTGELTQVVQLSPGQHAITAEYVANDHAPFCTRVSSLRRVTAIPAGSPAPGTGTPAPPQEGLGAAPTPPPAPASASILSRV